MTHPMSDLYVRRLYKDCVECVKKLDQTTKDKKVVTAIFLTENIAIRKRLSETCEKLFFHNPSEFGRKAEEIIWRKCFYEPIQHIRRNIETLSPKQRASFYLLLSSATGYYIGFLLKLQQEWNLKLDHVVDFPVAHLNWIEQPTKKDLDKNVEDLSLGIVHRILIYMGDLARYQQEFDKSLDFRMAQHFYHSALRLKPLHGQPHNQLGTLFAGRNQNLDAAFCYLRCIYSSESFSGAEGNLVQLLAKNQVVYQNVLTEMNRNGFNKTKSFEVKFFLTTYLQLVKILFEDSSDYNAGQQLQFLCQQTLQSFGVAITYLFPEKIANDDVYCVESSVIVKVFVTHILLIKKLQEKSSMKLSASISLLFSMYSQFLTHIIALITGHAEIPCTKIDPKSLKENDSNSNSKVVKAEDVSIKVEKVETKKPVKKTQLFSVLRRRRQNSGDVSENEDENENGSKPEKTHRFEAESDEEENGAGLVGSSDSDDVVELFSDDDVNIDMEKKTEVSNGETTNSNGATNSPEVTNGESNGGTICSQSSHSSSSAAAAAVFQDQFDVRKMNTKDIISQLSSCSWLVVVKVICDWLRCNPNLIVSIGGTSKNLWNCFAQILNLLPKEEKIKEFIEKDTEIGQEMRKDDFSSMAEWYQKNALVEDIYLRGVAPLMQAYTGLNFEHIHDPTQIEETVIRICCLRSFGHYLLRLNTSGFRYDRSRAEFFGQFEGKTVVEELDNEKRDNLMRNMAKLRLKDEKDYIDKIAWIPVYLVADSTALCEKLHVVKQLASAQKFVFVVPTSVVSELDSLKKESASAREAIRWLESQFQRGNKFVRSQKLEESAQIQDALRSQFAAANKSNVREIIGLIDCAAHLCRTVSSGASTVVCILTNDSVGASIFDSITNAISCVGVVGVSVDNVQRFCSRWQNYAKKKGNV